MQLPAMHPLAPPCLPKDQCMLPCRFVISFFVADQTLAVFEPPQPNTGIQGGKYLEVRAGLEQSESVLPRSNLVCRAGVRRGWHHLTSSVLPNFPRNAARPRLQAGQQGGEWSS